jgi:hypothetical protein
MPLPRSRVIGIIRVTTGASGTTALRAIHPEFSTTRANRTRSGARPSARVLRPDDRSGTVECMCAPLAKLDRQLRSELNALRCQIALSGRSQRS